MSHTVYRLYHERAFRDRSNPLDLYNDEELIERSRFCRRDLFELVEELSPDLQFVSDHSAALSPALQLLIALCFYANSAFQNTLGDMVGVPKSTTCRAIHRVSLALSRRLLQYAHLPTEVELAVINRDSARLPAFLVLWTASMRLRIQAPFQHKYLYVNRKGNHSINVQSASNANYNIFNLVARWPGFLQLDST